MSIETRIEETIKSLDIQTEEGAIKAVQALATKIFAEGAEMHQIASMCGDDLLTHHASLAMHTLATALDKAADEANLFCYNIDTSGGAQGGFVFPSEANERGVENTRCSYSTFENVVGRKPTVEDLWIQLDDTSDEGDWQEAYSILVDEGGLRHEKAFSKATAWPAGQRAQNADEWLSITGVADEVQ